MPNLWQEHRMLINGQLVAAVDGSTYANVNPATEASIGVAADGSAPDMDAAISAARAAFDGTDWSIDQGFRIRCLRQLHEALTKHSEELRHTTVAEVGCPVSLTYGAQLDAPIEGLRWIADVAENYKWIQDLGIAEPFGIASRRFLKREPTGVVGAITPWNFPVQINLAKIGPALAAGNTVVLKPAPDTPWTATLLGKLAAEETDMPPGVFNVVTSSGHAVGQQLADDPRVDMISFTGSTGVGRKIMIAGASNVKKVFLELGGKSALVALDDADLASAVAMAAFQITSHAGQGCAITSRLVLPRARYEEGIELLTQVLSSWPVGDPTDPGTMMGPLINARQRERVLGYVETGLSEGAEVRLGGGVPEQLPTGYFVEPTILANVKPGDTVAQEEIFGPVIAVLAHDGDDDALQIANHSAYGLSGAVFSESIDRARRFANRVRTGTMSINGGLYYGADAPFGGYKQSGVGRESGIAGFEEYLEIKTIAEPVLDKPR